MRRIQDGRGLLIGLPSASPLGDVGALERGASLLARAVARPRDGGEAVDDPELGSLWLKGGPLRRHAAWRHGLAWRVLLRLPPRLRECSGVRELSAAGLECLEPVLAAARFEGGRCTGQALALRREEEAIPFATVLRGLGALERLQHTRALAVAVAALHGAGVDHRDLYLRNALVVRRGAQRRVVLIDHWRGVRRDGGTGLRPIGTGLRPLGTGLRPLGSRLRPLAAARAARGLGQILVEAPRDLTPDEVLELLGQYFAHRNIDPLGPTGSAMLHDAAMWRVREQRRLGDRGDSGAEVPAEFHLDRTAIAQRASALERSVEP